MRPATDLRNAHAGRPVAVLGGGPSLPADLDRLPADAVLIAVNHHAFMIGVAADYLVFMDNPYHIPDLIEAVRGYEGRRIAPIYSLTDYDLSTTPGYLDAGCTAPLATWLACFMGGDPVLLCGMDLYRGEVRYCHGGHMPLHPAHTYPLDKQLVPWRRVLERFPPPNAIRAVSGPLVDIFGGFDA